MKINELTIYTSQLEALSRFYSETLELPLIQSSRDHFAVQLGKSILHVKFRHDATPYHFAVNIPSNKIEEARDWLQDRVTILKDMGDEIVDFQDWNAKSIYFYDPDKNIVEFIARQDLGVFSDRPFDSKSLLAISEIGIPVSDISRTFDELKKLSGFEIYDGNFERFCAVGDENGLFIIINKNQKKWFPINDLAYSSDFEINLENLGEQLSFAFRNEEIFFTG